MILKSNETELDILQKHPPDKESRLQIKMLPAMVHITVGRFGRIKTKEVVGITLQFDDAAAVYKFLHKRFGKLGG